MNLIGIWLLGLFFGAVLPFVPLTGVVIWALAPVVAVPLWFLNALTAPR